MALFDTLRATCLECVRDAETAQKIAICPKCAFIDKTQAHMVNDAAVIAAGAARWNALHPDAKPIGRSERLAAINEAVKEGGN